MIHRLLFENYEDEITHLFNLSNYEICRCCMFGIYLATRSESRSELPPSWLGAGPPWRCVCSGLHADDGKGCRSYVVCSYYVYCGHNVLGGPTARLLGQGWRWCPIESVFFATTMALRALQHVFKGNDGDNVKLAMCNHVGWVGFSAWSL